MRRALTQLLAVARRAAAAAILASCLPLAATAAPLRVAIISDLNGSYGSTTYDPAVGGTVRRLVEMRPDLVISTGDMVAGQRLHPPFERPALLRMWQSFHGAVSEPLREAGIPLAITPGNHDASAYSGFVLERAVFREEWRDRIWGLQFVDRADYPFRYAFSESGVLFISLDVTRVGALDADQLRWLDDLLTRKGGGFRHRVVFSHLPIYPFTQGRETEVSADHELERLLRRHDVELYLSGHHHAFYPGYHDGIRHIGQACLGAGARSLIGDSGKAPRAVTWLEFDEDAVRVSALVAPGLRRRIDVSTLPREIRSRYGRLVRDDLRQAAAAPRSGH